MLKNKFLVCDNDQTMIEVIFNNGEQISCGNKPMRELSANSTDAAQEKHIPVAKVEGNKVTVDIGSVTHPMEEAHSIQWVHLVTSEGIQRKYLNAGTDPVVEFALAANEKPEEVYAYCNLHGLWMIKL